MQQESVLTQAALGSLEAGDAVRALAALRNLSTMLWERRQGDLPARDLSTRFRTLLRRRGYFVESPQDLASSLEEIHGLGEGFDLYHVARELAALDTLISQCLKLDRGPLFPELQAFAPPCPCGRHPLRET